MKQTIIALQEIYKDLDKILETVSAGSVATHYDDNGKADEYADYDMTDNAYDDVVNIWRQVRNVLIMNDVQLRGDE